MILTSDGDGCRPEVLSRRHRINISSLLMILDKTKYNMNYQETFPKFK